MTDQPTPSTTKRKRGGQPGNLNGLKHGLYLEGKSIRNTTPIERAQLTDLIDIIHHFKDYMNSLYIEGKKCKTIDEYNATMHNMSLAALALTRLINVHNQYQNTSLPADFIITKKSTVLNLVEHYRNKISSILDLDDLDPALDSQDETPLPRTGEGSG